MSGEEKAKELTSSKEAKSSDLSTTSTSNSASRSGLGRIGPSSFGLVPKPDREKDDPQDAESIKRSLRQIGIRPPRPFDHKKIFIQNLRIGSIVSNFISKLLSAQSRI